MAGQSSGSLSNVVYGLVGKKTYWKYSHGISVPIPKGEIMTKAQ
jgi:hypothetical protein